MKNISAPALVLGLLCLVGCDSGNKVVDVPNPDRVERKEYKDMTKEERISFIEKTPMPREAKDKQIAAINAGTDK